MKKQGLGRKILALFGVGKEQDELYEDLEDALVEADLGSGLTMELVDELRAAVRAEKVRGREGIVDKLRELILQRLHTAEPDMGVADLSIVLVLGVNGVGKTTTIAKLAHRWHTCGVLLAAGDTFRAAAVEQISLHGERLGVRVVKQGQGADAGAVIYDAITSARSGPEHIVLADTAGRLHNKENLVRELEKIDRIVQRQASGAAYLRLLVVDATTGRNAVRQAEIFHDAVGLDGVILSKYDSSSKGGAIVEICSRLKLPIMFVGTGETMDSLAPFSPQQFVADLFEEA